MNRAKILPVVVALFVAVSGAFAGTSVQWYFIYGMMEHGQSDLYNGTGVAANRDVLWQLVYAGANGLPDDVSSANSGAGFVSADDVVLDSRTTTAGGSGIYDSWLYANPYPSPFETATTYSGNVFIRVFQDTTPADQEWYYDSPTLATHNIDITDPLRNPDALNGNVLNDRGDALDKQIPVIPEPSTVALVLLGLGIVGYRRFKNA
jgi:hypothetical protein